MILTREYYQLITGDATSPAQFASAASAAQELLEDELGRRGRLELAERTEPCDVYPDGTIYPQATPILSVVGGALVHDDVVYGASPDSNLFTGFFPGPDPSIVTLTYTGGFDSVSAPECMRRDLAWVTYAILRPAAVAGLSNFVGASSVSVGDVSVAYGQGGAVAGASVTGVVWSDATLRYREQAA